MSFTPDSMGFDLLPPDPGVISPDLALDAALVSVVDLDLPTPLPFGKGWLFDFTTSQFVKHGQRPAEVLDVANLQVWMEKVLRTAKYAHPIYSDDYGMEDPFELVGQDASDELIAAYEEGVTNALLVHDRIVAVEDFSFTQQPFDDSLYVSFTVVLDAGSDAPQTTLTLENVPVAAG